MAVAVGAGDEQGGGVADVGVDRVVSAAEECASLGVLFLVALFGVGVATTSLDFEGLFGGARIRAVPAWGAAVVAVGRAR